MNDGWYVAETDGTTHGPMSRGDAVRLANRNAYGSEAMAWHVDIGEWIPLTRVLMRFGRGAHGAADEAASAHAPPAEDRQRRREQASAQRAEASPVKAAVAAAERKRRVAETVRQPPPTIPTAPTVDPKAAAESAAKLGQAAKRLLARYIDLMSIGLLGAIVLVATLGRSQGWAQRISAEGATPDTAMLLWIAFIALLLLDTALLATFGTTPGKSVLGLRVENLDGTKPSWAQSWNRALLVFARGCGLGIPVVAQVAMFIAGAQTLSAGQAPWDAAQGLRIRSTPVESGQWKLIAIGGVVLWIAVADGWWLGLYQWLLRVQ